MVDDTPDDLVFELHSEALWGAHPYGYSILGTRDTVASLAHGATCARCTRAPTIPAQLVVAASGNVEHDALLDVAASAPGWTARAAGDASRLVVPPPVAEAPRRRARDARRARRRTSSSAARPSRTATRAGMPWCCSARCSAAG